MIQTDRGDLFAFPPRKPLGLQPYHHDLFAFSHHDRFAFLSFNSSISPTNIQEDNDLGVH